MTRKIQPRSDKFLYYEGTINQKLFWGDRETNGLSTNSDHQRVMATVGYTPEKIESFREVYKVASTAHLLQQKETSDKLNAYLEFEELFKASKSELHYLCKVARVAFKDHPAIVNELNLNKKKGRSMADILRYMESFYTHVLDNRDILHILDSFCYPESRLITFRDNYNKSKTAYEKYGKDTALSVEVTRVRNQKMEELDEWMYDYYALRKVAYTLNPDWLDGQDSIH